MTVASARVVVGNAPTKLTVRANPAYAQQGALLVKNPAANVTTVDLGGAAVAAGAGYELAPGDPGVWYKLGEGEDVYAISQGANVTLQVMQGGLV